jgi:hypothetical protein
LTTPFIVQVTIKGCETKSMGQEHPQEIAFTCN